MRTECKNGHDLTKPGSFYGEADGTRRCKECKRQAYAIRARQQWAKARASQPVIRDDTKLGIERANVHHQMLALIQERERCATWWEREAIDQRYAALQRMLGTVEA